MRKILFSVMAGSIMILVSCNDGSSSTSNNMDTTSTMSADSSSSMMDNSVMKKTLQLTSDQEVPANDSKGSGTAEVSYDKSNHMLTYTITYSGLTGDATMAHIHGTAPKGSNAGVVRNLTDKLQKSPSGSFSDSVMIDGNTIKEDSLLNGFYYFNIHTKKNPGGEIRTQIEL